MAPEHPGPEQPGPEHPGPEHPGPQRRPRRSRRAIRLSVTDQRRLDAGEISDPTEALHAPEDPRLGGRGSSGVAARSDATDVPAVGAVEERAGKRPARPSAEDERILREVPPHFGPL